MITTPEVFAGEAVDLDDVSPCIAEQIVRVKLSAARYMRGPQQGNDTSPLLTAPLYALATALGIRERVLELVSDALAGAA